MIKNDRQYKITAAQARKFELAIDELRASESHSQLHPKLLKAQLDALKSQYDELWEDLRDYDSLKQHRPAQIEANSLEELPTALIRARIALDLSQADLALRAGLKAQQIQRYEASNYETATLSRLSDIAKALGVRIAETVLLPQVTLDRKALVSRLSTSGLSLRWLKNRVLPPTLSEEENTEEGPDLAVSSSMQVMNRIFEWHSSDMLGVQPLRLPKEGAALARFKVAANAEGRNLAAYVVYAYYLARLTAKGVEALPKKKLVRDSLLFRNKIVDRNNNITLLKLVETLWDEGVAVVPLSDSGAFHGACWRIAGRNIIVLKQRSPFESRWIFDLLHEYYHILQSESEDSFGWIEDDDLTSTRRVSEEEQAANQFAADVLMFGKAESFVQDCVDLAQGNVARLKSAVPKIASQHGISQEHLANYLAYRLSLQKINWWGAAGNLQHQTGDPYQVVRSVFFNRFDFSTLDKLDSDLLRRALLPSEDL